MAGTIKGPSCVYALTEAPRSLTATQQLGPKWSKYETPFRAMSLVALEAGAAPLVIDDPSLPEVFGFVKNNIDFVFRNP